MIPILISFPQQAKGAATAAKKKTAAAAKGTKKVSHLHESDAICAHAPVHLVFHMLTQLPKKAAGA